MRCRVDIDRLNDAFITIVKSLIPAEEEKAKQQQLLTLLEKLIIKEWPTARLYLYGSCANSFGVSKSDVDLCLVMEDTDINKAEVLLKLADILQSDNLQNVQVIDIDFPLMPKLAWYLASSQDSFSNKFKFTFKFVFRR